MTIEHRPPTPHELHLAEHADAVVAVEDGEVIGHIVADRVDLTVPGGARLTAAGITSLEVAPNHTRRGVLTGMMRSTVDEARDRGQVMLLVDRPSTTLVERFGFGPAAEAVAVEVDAACARPLRRATEEGFEPLPVEQVLSALPDAYDRAGRDRVGTIGRTPATWVRIAGLLSDPPEDHLGDRVVVHRDSTALVDGYAVYELRSGTGSIHELVASDPEIERGLWSWLLGHDQVATWRVPRRPPDDIARYAVADPRSYRTTARFDTTWVRLLDLDVALGTRTYGSTIANITVRVDDPWYHANSGTWRIDSYGSFRSQTTPDLILGIDMLSAVYLGGTSWRELRDAGRLVEQRRGAAHDADVLFGVRPLPFDHGVPFDDVG